MPQQYDPGFMGWFAPSRMYGEIEQPTDTRALGSPFMGQPEQALAFLQDPAMQKRFAEFGIPVQQMLQNYRQSPFFTQGYMQQHPLMGGALTRALAAGAMTPDMQQPQGFGGGFSRMAQGLMGGPEMLRQYQMRQLMAPFQAMGMSIPGMEFQRKQQLLETLQQRMEAQEKQSAAMFQQSQKMQQQQMDETRRWHELEFLKAPATRDTATGATWANQLQSPGMQIPFLPGMQGPVPGFDIPPGALGGPGKYLLPGSYEMGMRGRGELEGQKIKGRKDVAETGAQGRRDVASIMAGSKSDLQRQRARQHADDQYQKQLDAAARIRGAGGAGAEEESIRIRNQAEQARNAAEAEWLRGGVETLQGQHPNLPIMAPGPPQAQAGPVPSPQRPAPAPAAPPPVFMWPEHIHELETDQMTQMPDGSWWVLENGQPQMVEPAGPPRR